MIAHLRGTVAEKFNHSVILDVAGVGYEVLLTANEAETLKLEDNIKIYTFHYVREQTENLFGFMTLAGKKLFELLITIQGIGPKNAMAILSLGTAEEILSAIANADTAFISKAAGVGKKSAERAIIDLKDKVGLPTYYGRRSTGVQPASAETDEALEALMALGFQLAEATKALENIDSTIPTEERLRLALKK